MDNKKKSILLAILACLVWSTAFFSLKISLRYETPLHLAGFRFMLAGIMIMPFCRNYKSNIKTLWRYKSSFFKISFFQTFGLYSLFHLGINLVPASVTALIIGAGPLFISILAIFLNNESMTKRKLFAMIAGLTGIGVIAFGRSGGLIKTEVSLLGIGLLLIANISGSIGNIMVSKNKIPVNPVFVNAFQLFTGGLGIFVLSLFVEGIHFSPKPFEFYIALLWIGAIGSIGFSLWFIVLNIPGVKVSEINVWKFMIPVTGAVLSWLILPDESPEWIVFTGMLLVSSSLLIMYYKTKK